VIEVEISEGILKDLPENPKAWVLGQLLPLSHFQKVIDPETHMASAFIELPDSFPKQIIGTAIDVELVVKESPAALVIPHEALFIQDQKIYVYGVEGKKAVRTLVEVGIRQKDKVEILDGVKENDQIIWRGQNRLYDGIDVEPYDPTKSQFEK
jgi:membrane fusion protein (multidrug efflux system)